MLNKDEVAEKFLSRCAHCYKIAENEFIPLLCSRCLDNPSHGVGVLLPSRASRGNHKYIELDFYQPLGSHVKESFLLLLWLTYETQENHLATWQGVLSVTRGRAGETLFDKFDSYAKALIPAYKTVFDVICCKVEKQAAG
jgi:hypothetical protein